MMVNKLERERTFSKITIDVDYVVAGGGLAGVCNAIAAARDGLTVALIQDRPVLGGNASSEVRIWALGATSHMGNNNRWSREGGIIDEIMVENTFRNREGNPVLFDTVLMDKVLAEKNITLLLNTTLYQMEKEGDRKIISVTAINPQNGTEYVISARLFADCTGDGTLGYLAGASYRMGAEEKDIYDEGFTPDKEKYGELLGHSILFYVKDTGKPVNYIAPDFALKNVEKLIPKLQNPHYFNVGQHGCKYWWLEYGGRLDTVHDTETIKFELWKVIYGVWDYIKNSGKFPQAENLTLEWAGLFPGKRESRRFNGLYTITQQDIIEQRRHYDAVAYGGWAIDLHPSDGVYADGNACNQWHSKGVYQIPYRCYVTPDIDNLFIGGRIMSSSHVANGSTRVMCTAALGGEVIGRAAAICIKNSLTPIELAAPDNIGMLQVELIGNGNFIPDTNFKVRSNLAGLASISVSSELKLSSLPADGTWFRLDYSAAQLIPVAGRMPVIGLTVEADDDCELELQLRSSSKKENYTPDVIDAVIKLDLKKGENDFQADFDVKYEEARYVFICLMANEKVMIPMSSHIVSGITSVFNYINPAVSNFGKQAPPENIGVEAFEFWCPKRRPEGKNFAMTFNPALKGYDKDSLATNIYRPYLIPNGWAASVEDREPELKLVWTEVVELKVMRLFFDTDSDHAMESVQMGHSESVMPCCYREYEIFDDKGNCLTHVKGNHQTVNTIYLDKPCCTTSLTIHLVRPAGNVCPALMGILIE